MGKAKYIVVTILIFINTFTLGLSVFRPSINSNSINCISVVRMVHENIKIQATYFFHLRNEKGSLKVNGLIIEDDKFLSDISRTIIFTYRNKGETYTLTSSSINALTQKDEARKLLNEHYPPFFVKENKNIAINIVRDGERGYVFSHYGFPLFYCQTLTL